MPLVVACVADRQQAARLATAVRGKAQLLCAARLSDVRDLLQQYGRRVAAVVFDEQDADGVSPGLLVREIRSRWPRTAIIAKCGVGIEHSQHIRDLGAAGAHEFLFPNDDAGAAFRAVLQSAQRQCAAVVVFGAVNPLLAQRVIPFVRVCLESPERAKTVSDAAKILGRDRGTIDNWCREDRVLTPGELLTWLRLLLVGYWVEDGRTVQSIAVDMAFASDTALRNLIKTHTRMTATEVREAGGFAFVLSCFERRLTDCRSAAGQRA